MMSMRFGRWATRGGAAATPECKSQTAAASANTSLFMRVREGWHNLWLDYKLANGAARTGSPWVTRYVCNLRHGFGVYKCGGGTSGGWVAERGDGAAWRCQARADGPRRKLETTKEHARNILATT